MPDNRPLFKQGGNMKILKKGDRVTFRPGHGHPDLDATVVRYPGYPGSPHTVGIVLEGQREVRVSPLANILLRRSRRK